MAIASAITFGGYSVYHRALTERHRDARQHLEDIATRLARYMARVQPEDSQAAPQVGEKYISSLFRLIEETDREVERVYAFKLTTDDDQTFWDAPDRSGRPGRRALPDAAREARRFFRDTVDPPESWVRAKDAEITGFAAMETADGKSAVGVEVDPDHLMTRLANVRAAFHSTALGGVILGLAAGVLVWRIRSRSWHAAVALDESRLVQNAIIETLGEIVYIYDIEHDEFRWRGDLGELLADASGNTPSCRADWARRIVPDDAARYLEAQENACASSQPLALEYRALRKDGSEVWLLDRGNPIEIHGRRQLVGSLIDLTDRHTAEELLQLFFDETALAHLVFHGDEIVNANPAALTLFRSPAKAVLMDLPLWSLWPRRQPNGALSAEGWANHVLTAMESSQARFEWKFTAVDGTLIDCDVFLRPATLGGRHVLLMACHDISVAKAAQAQLIESEQRFRDVSEAVGEFVWEVDASGKFIYASRRILEIMGVPASEALGRSPLEWVPEEDVAEVRARSQAFFAARAPFRNFEHRIRRSDGRILWISVSGVPIFDAAGHTTGYRGATLDISRHRAYEQELLLQKEAAEAADRAKSNFLAMMSHEIRTPLNSVLGFADLALETELTETQRDHIATIRQSGDALLVLLNDILDFSKIESGRLEIEKRPTEIRKCIREVIELYRLSARAKGLVIRSDIADDVPEWIVTDWSRLRQILLNLVGNAVKFTPSGVVEIRITRSVRTVELPTLLISVSDTGVGIPDEQRERLFRPFSQADSSTTRRFGGTGLGLAISKRLASLLGGTLTLGLPRESGSEFLFEIPLLLPSAEDLAGQSEPEPPTFIAPAPHLSSAADASASLVAGVGPRVLVVDDNALNRRLTTQILLQLNARPSDVSNAADCLARIFVEPVDLIFMDVQMPGMDGLEATREIRRIEAEKGIAPIPIVALTADAMVGDRERCLAAGMDDYLSKPLRRPDIVRVLNRFFGTSPQA